MILLQQCINGLMLGSTFSLLAIGYTLVFGVLKMLNMAHGEVYMIAAFFAWAMVTLMKMSFFTAFIVASMMAALLGLVVQFACFRFVNKDYPLASLLSTIGFGIVLQNVALVFSKGEMVRFPSALPDFNITMGTLVISGTHLMILVTGLGLMFLLQLLVYRTSLGKALRAVAENQVVAGMYGLNVNFIVGVTFAISSALAGVAGVLTALAYHCITPFMGVQMGLKGLTVIVLGGMGSLTGAMIGGLLLGLGEVLAMGYLPMHLTGYKDAIAFIILIAVLLIKPSGLLGRLQEVKV